MNAEDLSPGEAPWRSEWTPRRLTFAPLLLSLTPAHPGKRVPCAPRKPESVAAQILLTARRLGISIETCRYQRDGVWWIAVRLKPPPKDPPP
jgi:hypothetical protein